MSKVMTEARTLKVLTEAKDLGTYKKLLHVLADYTMKFPATGLDKLFNVVIDKGMKVLPSDEKALCILDCALHSADSVPAAITRLTNSKFSDLDSMYGKPSYVAEDGSKHTAFWTKDGKTSDMVLSLLNVEGDKGGQWTDDKGNKVKLIGA